MMTDLIPRRTTQDQTQKVAGTKNDAIRIEALCEIAIQTATTGEHPSSFQLCGLCLSDTWVNLAVSSLPCPLIEALFHATTAHS
eukprot:4830838-Amphidinium_carterae.2